MFVRFLGLLVSRSASSSVVGSFHWMVGSLLVGVRVSSITNIICLSRFSWTVDIWTKTTHEHKPPMNTNHPWIKHLLWISNTCPINTHKYATNNHNNLLRTCCTFTSNTSKLCYKPKQLYLLISRKTCNTHTHTPHHKQLHSPATESESYPKDFFFKSFNSFIINWLIN